MTKPMPTIEPAFPGRDNRVGLLLTTPFHPQHEDITAALKELPRQDRYFVPDSEGWWIAADHLEAVKAIVLEYWPSLLLLGEGGEDDQYISRNGGAASQGRLL